jgi:hypothetical protein
MKHRVALFVVLSALLWAGDLYFNAVGQPDRSSHATLRAVNGDGEAARAVRAESLLNNQVNLGFGAAQLLVALACFAGAALDGMRRASVGAQNDERTVLNAESNDQPS